MVIWITTIDEGLIHGERNHWIESYDNVWHVTCVTQHDGNVHKVAMFAEHFWSFYVTSGRVMSCFIVNTPATKYNRVDKYCLASQLGREPHTGRTVFSHFSFLKKFQNPGAAKLERNLSEIWQTLGQKSERFSSQILSSLAGYAAD